ncbi:MAG: GNAT family N-acetyltransferase [Cellulosilyticaceae bacterium]
MEVYLKDMGREDVEYINKWRKNKNLIARIGGNFRYVNLEADMQWFEDYMNNRKTQVRCMICIKETNEIVGGISLFPIDYMNQKAEFHILIGEEAWWGKGVGEASTRLMLEHGFKNLNLNRIYLTVLEDNIAALKLYEKVGFIKEGREEAYLYKDGKFKTAITMRILKAEYLKNC